MEDKKPQSAPAPTKAPTQPASPKAAQPAQKKPNIEVRMESAAKPSPIKTQAPAAKAFAPKTPAAKVSSAPNTTIPTPRPKTKAEPFPETAPALKEQIKASEQQATNGGAFIKLATKGFVIQSWQLALAAAVVLALVTGAVFLGTTLGGDKGPDLDDSAIDYDWILSDGNSTTPGGIILPGYPALTFPAGESRIELVLPNPLNNPCYFRYTLTIVETGEVLYQSKLIAPGQAVLAADLSRALPVGTYTLRIMIDTFSLADGTTPMNGGVQEVKLNVK